MRKAAAAHIRLGRSGELAAIRFLRRKGFEILGHDVKLSSAEIDIIARDGGTFVLVEVKTIRYRPGMSWNPEENYSEQQKIRQFRARKELQRRFEDADFPFRHDFIGVLMGRFYPMEIRHVTDFYRYRQKAALSY